MAGKGKQVKKRKIEGTLTTAALWLPHLPHRAEASNPPPQPQPEGQSRSQPQPQGQRQPQGQPQTQGQPQPQGHSRSQPLPQPQSQPQGQPQPQRQSRSQPQPHLPHQSRPHSYGPLLPQSRTDSQPPLPKQSRSDSQPSLPQPNSSKVVQPDPCFEDASNITTVEAEEYTEAALYSARTGKTLAEEAGDPITKKKKHREVVTGRKVHAWVGLLGRPIDLDYDANTEGPANSALADIFTRYLGAKVRDKAKMLSPTWSESLQEHKEIITLAISPFFKLHPNLTNWADDLASLRYKNWKYKLHQHYQDFKDRGRLGTPREFFRREDEWRYLCDHFESDEFKRKSEANSSNRQKKKYNHKSGPTPFKARYERAVEAGAQVPAIKVIEEIYPQAKEELVAIKTVAAEHIKKAAKDQFPDTPDDQLPLEDVRLTDLTSQGLILAEALKPNNIHHIMGLGKVGNGLLVKFHGRQSRLFSRATDEAMENAKEEAARAQEDAQRAREEAQRAKEEAAKAMEMVEETSQQNQHLMVETRSLREAVTDLQGSIALLMQNLNANQNVLGRVSMTSVNGGDSLHSGSGGQKDGEIQHSGT